MTRSPLAYFVLTGPLLISISQVHALDNFRFNIGGDLGLGRMGNENKDLDQRTMSAFSVNALPGYQLNSNWILGLNLNYRIQRQQTAPGSVDNSNLSGKAYTFGPAAVYQLNERWGVQAALHILGDFTFDKKTVGNEDSSLSSPIGVDLKTQYYARKDSKWSYDAGLNFTQWNKYDDGNSETTSTFSNWIVSVGITYHWPASEEKVVVVPPPAGEDKVIAVPPPAEVAQVLPVTSESAIEKTLTDKGYKVSLQSGGFKPYGSEVSPELKAEIAKIADVIKNDPGQTIIVKGYTDTSGSEKQNQKISEQRASAVKDELLKNGIPTTRVIAQGLGSKNPIADNSTKEGREQNRRIEIEIEK